MKVSIIGSGNVATVMVSLLTRAGHTIPEVCSRNLEHAAALASNCGAAVAPSVQQLDGRADLYLVAVADSAIAEVVQHFPHHDKLMVHTAGTVSREVLAPATKRYGVLYPLQSLRKELDYIPAVPLLVDGNTPETLETITQLAGSISNMVMQADDKARLHLHLAAVVVSNFTNHLYTLAADYCAAESVAFPLLYPLIQETAFRVQQAAPASVQTGPAVRNDLATIETHLMLLQRHEALLKMYSTCTESILAYYHSREEDKKNPHRKTGGELL